MHLTRLLIFGIFLHNNFPSESIKVIPDGIVHEAFKADAFHRITSHLIETKIVTKLKFCAFSCVKNIECLSFNFGNPIHGTHDCQLLRTDKYNSNTSYTKSTDFHHFYSVNKCMDPSPCQHNGKCYPDYDNDAYHCVCNKTWGKNCENYIGIKNSTILLNYGKANYTQTLFDYLDAALMSSSSRIWSRCWHAASDGWDTRNTFHLRCNVKNTVTIVRVGSYIFGGFSDTAWNKSQHYMFSKKSFLFSLYNANGSKPIKLNLVHGSDSGAISGDYGNSGPVFGGGNDLSIASNANMNKNSYTIPHTYDTPEGCIPYEHCNIFAGESPFTTSDVEVFKEIIN